SALLLDPNPKNSPDPQFTEWLRSIHPSIVQVIVALIGASFVFLWLQHWVTSLELKVQFRELVPRQENLRRLEIDTLRFFMVLTAVFVLFLIGGYLPSTISSALGKLLVPLLRVLLLSAVYLFAGLIIAYVIGFCIFLVVRMVELGEKKHFVGAEELATRSIDISSVYAREEGGTNTYQNHLASLTYVKPGLLRAWGLRLTLFVIGLLSRFWFNVGDLGGI